MEERENGPYCPLCGERTLVVVQEDDHIYRCEGVCKAAMDEMRRIEGFEDWEPVFVIWNPPDKEMLREYSLWRSVGLGTDVIAKEALRQADGLKDAALHKWLEGDSGDNSTR